MQHEKRIQSQIVTLLRSVGAAVYVLGTRRGRGDYQGTRQTPGLPDIWTILPPSRIGSGPAGVWIEVKAPHGKRSREQEAFAAGCNIASVPYLCGGLDDVIAFLVERAYLKPAQLAHYRQPRVM